MRAKPSKSEQLEVRRLMESFASIASSGLYEAGGIVKVAPASWKGYATGARKMPAYIQQSVRAHIALCTVDPRAFQRLVGTDVSTVFDPAED